MGNTRDRPSRWTMAAAMAATLAWTPGAGAGAGSGAGPAALFERLAGSWSGTGAANVAGDSPERIRCSVTLSSEGASTLQMQLRCASDAFNFQVQSSIARQGDRISGTWTETSVGLSGEVSGSAEPDRIRANIAGVGVSAQISMTLRDGVQTVTIVSQSPFAASATVSLRRV